MFMVSVFCLTCSPCASSHLSEPSLHSPAAHILWTLVTISLRSVPGFIPPHLPALLPTAPVDQIKLVRLSPHTHLPGRPPSLSLSLPSLTHSTCQVRRKPIQYHWIQYSVLLCSFPNCSLLLSTVPSYLRYYTSHLSFRIVSFILVFINKAWESLSLFSMFESALRCTCCPSWHNKMVILLRLLWWLQYQENKSPLWTQRFIYWLNKVSVCMR